MSVLDLFCGAAGGWSLGLHRAGFTTVAACEIDPWRRAVFSANFPKAKLYGDVKEVAAARIVSDIGYLPTVIVGSPPCQDASLANSRGYGVDGARTGLFSEAIRLVREIRPDWACFENVPGLRTRGYDWVANELEEAGYAVWPLVVGAVHAGAPHLRKRIWIVAHANGQPRRGEYVGRRTRESDDKCTFPNSQNFGCGSGRPRRFDSGDSGQCEQAFHDPDAAPLQRIEIEGRQPNGDSKRAFANAKSGQRHALRGNERQSEIAQAWISQWQDWNGGAPALGGMDDGLPRGMARQCLAAYGDAVVPQIAEAIGRAILAGAPANVE